jgi:hypothetical protein
MDVLNDSLEYNVAPLLNFGPNALKQTLYATLAFPLRNDLDNAVGEQDKEIAGRMARFFPNAETSLSYR